VIEQHSAFFHAAACVFFLSDILLLSDGLGQCRQVPPNLSKRSDTIWRLLFQKKTLAAGHGAPNKEQKSFWIQTHTRVDCKPNFKSPHNLVAFFSNQKW
jgi:hypothetical protein